MNAHKPYFADRLREETRICHDRVDREFACFALDDPAGYRSFLDAHAQAVLRLETYLGHRPAPAPYRPRGDLLLYDLADLKMSVPGPRRTVDIASDEASRWGVVYVLEGSRLGGAMLAKRVPENLPKRYLSAKHGPGGWKAIREELNAWGSSASIADRERAIVAARQSFALFEQAAKTIGEKRK